MRIEGKVSKVAIFEKCGIMGKACHFHICDSDDCPIDDFKIKK